MIPWEDLDSARVPGDGQEMTLHRRGEEYSIRVGGLELMNSRAYGSEEALAELPCELIKDRTAPRTLIGGLGMGFTVGVTLALLSSKARVEVAELVPEVVKWNHKYLSHLAGHPLKDRRVIIRQMDVAKVLRKEQAVYDAIMLDVDNGPEGMTSKHNDWLYTDSGIFAAYAALKPSGVLAVWSAGADKAFVNRLKKAGFKVKEHRMRARGAKGGSSYVVWIGTRGTSAL